MKIVNFLISILSFSVTSFAQSIEVQGELKISTVNQNNSGTDILVRNPDGTLAKRDASTMGAESPGTNIGDIKYWNGSSWLKLPIGSPGQILTTSQSNIPQWKSVGKTYIKINGNITNEQAAIQLTNEFGINTEFIWIENTTSLTSIDLNGVASLVQLRILNNAHLTIVGLNGLATVDEYILVDNNPMLSSLHFPIYNSSSAGFYCYSNLTLNSVTMPALTTNRLAFQLLGNPLLTSISLPSLEINTGTLLFSDNTNLTTLSFPSLEINAGRFSLTINNSLTSLNFPLLISTGPDEFECTNNPNLSIFNWPSISSINTSTFYLSGNKFSSSAINGLLAKFAAFGGPTLSEIYLNNQTPPAPPTGQGLIDKVTLENNGVNVSTD
jgi:hypothetical protein